MDKKSDYLTLIRNRENLYRFLSRLYREEVDDYLLNQMKLISFPDESPNFELSEGYKIVKNYIQNFSNNLLDDLSVDYARIFLGAGIAETFAAFPYESVYTSSRKIIMQAARDQVKSIYTANGLRKVDDRPEFFEDHISLELEFMAFLCNKAQLILNNEKNSDILACFNDQIDFLKGHLLNWICGFCNDVEKYANTDFYKGIGKITSGYLKMDSEILENCINELTNNAVLC